MIELDKLTTIIDQDILVLYKKLNRNYVGMFKDYYHIQFNADEHNSPKIFSYIKETLGIESVDD